MNSEIKNPYDELKEFNVEQRAWDYLCKNMGLGNEIIVYQLKMAEEVRCTRQSIANVLKKLQVKKFVVKIGKDQTNSVYMLNPNKVWRGDVKLMQKSISKFEQYLHV